MNQSIYMNAKVLTIQRTSGLVLLFFIFLSSCSEVEAPKLSNDNYYPLEVGNTWIYEIDSTVYNTFTKDSTRYVSERKEEITSMFRYDSINANIYIISVSVRNDTSSTWNLTTTYRAETDGTRFILKIDNTPFVKLIYPVRDLLMWDQNQMNTLGLDEVRYRNVGQSTTLKDLSFDQTFKVDQNNERNPFETNIEWEKYAKDVGLIEKYVEKTKFEANIKSGVRYHWNLKSYLK